MTDTALNPRKVGIHIECVVCHQTKTPNGRSAPLMVALCDRNCPGYLQEPRVGSLWPNESEADFGYPVADVGTEIR